MKITHFPKGYAVVILSQRGKIENIVLWGQKRGEKLDGPMVLYHYRSQTSCEPRAQWYIRYCK